MPACTVSLPRCDTAIRLNRKLPSRFNCDEQSIQASREERKSETRSLEEGIRNGFDKEIKAGPSLGPMKSSSCTHRRKHKHTTI